MRLLQHWAAEQAVRRPGRAAVVAPGQQLSYGEIEALSSRLARLLVHHGCERGDRVAVLMPKSPLAIAAILAIYKADAIYVPLDAASPPVRLNKILEACEPRLLLAAGTAALTEELLRDNRWRRTLVVGWLEPGPPAADFEPAFGVGDLAACATAPVPSRNAPDDPAHILFTSGSTGTPKGVVITHANVIAFVEWAVRYFGLDDTDRVSGHPPLHFDLSFFDIFGTMAAGGELHLVPPELNLLPTRLADFIRANRLTQWFSVPSVLTYMASFDAVRPGDFPSLRRLLWCGDVLPTPTLTYWMTRLPHVAFTNLYGPTEATIASSVYTVPACPSDQQAPIPIGTACDGEALLVLDESMGEVPPGETGDLYIGGVGLAAGYWRDDERTAAAFVARPGRPSERIYRTGDLARVGADGLVYFLGRRDTQIKSRGYRIELGEIEAAMNTMPSIRECAVVAVEGGGFEGAVICCAYVPAAGSYTTTALLRKSLARLVPGYMLPARWLALDLLPKNANGKTDRPHLRGLFERKADLHATQTA